MTTLSAREIAGVARAAGFGKTPKMWQTAVAVALAESSGRADVVNAIGATGLWQINQPVWVRSHPNWSKEWLKNPRNNASAAYIISNRGTNWTPWVAYTSGAYKVHWIAAGQAIDDPTDITHDTQIPGNKGTPFQDSTLGGIVSFGDMLSNPDTWIRLGLFLAGSVLLVIGLFKATGDNQLSGTTKALASAAVTKGMVK